MKFLDEYRNPEAVRAIAEKIRDSSEGRRLKFMEVCGTHTMAITRFGIRSLLPENIRLISGPGCPVCVTPNAYVDHAIAIGRLPDTIITTFGDMMRVPGSSSSLEKEKSNGGDIRIVYSPLDALEIARSNPDKEIIFLSVGFETTTPATASCILMAKSEGLKNISFLTANKVVPPALTALLSGKLNLHGFLLPGHVSTIIGGKAYEPIVEKYRIPCSVAGFEPTDILTSILYLTEQNISGTPKLEIDYKRAVNRDGNLKAWGIVNEVFEQCDAEWRGIGTIPASGLRLKECFTAFNAAKKFDVVAERTRTEDSCICGTILQGLADPNDCPLYGKKCTPEMPVGACMVSSEGTCAAHYKYGVLA